MIAPRIWLYAGLGAVLLAGGLWVRHEWIKGREAIAEAQELRKTLAAERAAKVAADTASKGYQDELERLRNRPVSREPIRLCVRSPKVPAVAAAAGPRPPAPAGGVVSGGNGTDHQEGPDIGPDLRELARRADEVSAQLRAVHGIH